MVSAFHTFILMTYIQMKAEKNHIPLISIKEMTRGYLDSKRVLFKKFNRELEKGDFTVITGKSGTGKSTLMKFLI